MRCTECGGELRLGIEEYCKDDQGRPIHRNYAYCDHCKTKTPLGYNLPYTGQSVQNQTNFKQMPKIIQNMLRWGEIIIGIISLFFSIVGIYSASNGDQITGLIMIIFFGLIAFLLLHKSNKDKFLDFHDKYMSTPMQDTHLKEEELRFEVASKVDELNNVRSKLDSINNNIETATTDLTAKDTEVKDKNDTYANDNGTIQRIDGKAISDEEIPYLMQMGYEKTLKTEQSVDNPIFHRTEKDDDLSFQFISKYGHELDTYVDQFESLYNKACETNDLSAKIALLNESVESFEKAKKFCYSKGKGGTIYFQDMYENLHNSKNQCFSYLDDIKATLNTATYQKNIVIPNILDVIAKNDGIYQSNIYRLLPDINKTMIQYTLKNLEAENKISRIKKGNSYELHMKYE